MGPIPPPFPYELRLAIFGPRRVAAPDDLAAAIERVLREQVINVLEGASAEPYGPHGVRLRPYDRLLRTLTRILAVFTGVVSVIVEGLTAGLGAFLKWLGLGAGGRLKLPIVPCARRRPDPERRTPLELTVITSLAPGAEQIGAAVVCDRLIPHVGDRRRPLETVLPLGPEQWGATFELREDVAELRRLLEKDRGEPTVIDTSVQTEPGGDAKAHDRARHRIVDSAEIVIVVWDPRSPDDHDRLGEIATYAANNGRMVLWISPNRLDDRAIRLEGRPLDSKGSPGRSTDRPPSAMDTDMPAGTGELTSAERAALGAKLEPVPVPNRAKQLSPNFHRLAAFNRDAAWDRDEYARLWARESARLEKDSAKAGLPRELRDLLCDEVLPQFVRADQQAQRYHALRDRAASLFPLTAAAIVTMIAFQIIFYPQHYWVAWIEVLVIVIAYVSHRVSVYEAWHDKWLNDRHLAEHLRAVPFLAPLDAADPAGADASRYDGDDHRLPYYRPTNAWFEATLARFRGRMRRRCTAILDGKDVTRPLAQFIREGWVEAEAAHHDSNARHCRRAQLEERILLLVTSLAIVTAAVLHGLGVGHGHNEGHAEHASPLTAPDLWVSFLSVALPAWGAAFHATGAVLDHGRLGERSRNMKERLNGQAHQLEEVPSMQRLRKRVGEVEHILDLEKQDFAESMRSRHPELHV